MKMNVKRRVLYDTRFIAATYYPKNEEEAAGIQRELTGTIPRSVSSVTVYEVYKLSLEAEGKQTAELRIQLIRQDFTVVNVDWGIAREAALVWKKYKVPMADAIIAATAMRMNAPCVTNDEHLLNMKELKTRWV
jgi:predicted nucleic acid-binding protein